MDNQTALIQVKNLKTYFYLDEGIVKAVDGVDFEIQRGKTLGIVGESGCGKSVTARSIMRILSKSAKIVDGEILFNRVPKVVPAGGPPIHQMTTLDLTKLDPYSDEMRSIRGGEISMVFQEPMTSLSPVHTIGNQIGEVITLHQKVSEKEGRAITIDMLERVGMPQPSRTIDRYPHELSGGMRQRAMIAMALSCHPSLLIADEPTTALDVTTEAQILTLMRVLQNDLGMAIMFITHNLGVIAQMAERVVVMYLGKVVEDADVEALFYNTKHPYTQALLQSIPRLGMKKHKEYRLASIRGTVPDPYNMPKGCPFHPRCYKKIAGVCDVQDPPNVEVEPGHKVRCILYQNH